MFAVRYDMQNMPLCMQNTPAICANEVIGSSAGLVPINAHDFEETFILLEGQMGATFRGQNSPVRAGETLNIPANAPHQFHNASGEAVRMLCICYLLSCRAGEILLGGWSSGRHSYHTSAQAL